VPSSLCGKKIKMNLLYQFNQFIQQHSLFQKNDRLLITVSGGVDSIVLCELCHLSGYNFEIAHCNFQLRGEDSEADELLVNDTAKTVTITANTKTLLQALQEEGIAPIDNVKIQINNGKITVNGKALTEEQNAKFSSYLKKD